MSLTSADEVQGPKRLAAYWEKRPLEMQAAPYAALVLRLMLASFFIIHLHNKLSGGGVWGFFRLLAARNYPAYVPAYVLTAEFFGALLLPLGLRTRWVALWAVPDFLGIIQYWFHKGGYAFTHPGAEFPIMWLCMLVLQIILGDGAYSLKIKRVRA